MRKKHRIWVVVADGVQARIFAPDDELQALHPAGVGEFRWSTGRRPSRELRSDAPGRSFSSARNGTRHAVEPHHDYHKLEKHRFTAALAEILDLAAAEGAFEDLILAAPKRSIGELRTELSERVKSRIGQEISKDLTNVSPHELWKKLGPAVRKVVAHAQMG